MLSPSWYGSRVFMHYPSLETLRMWLLRISFFWEIKAFSVFRNLLPVILFLPHTVLRLKDNIKIAVTPASKSSSPGWTTWKTKIEAHWPVAFSYKQFYFFSFKLLLHSLLLAFTNSTSDWLRHCHLLSFFALTLLPQHLQENIEIW